MSRHDKKVRQIKYNHWSTTAFHWCHVFKNMRHLSLRVSKRLTLSSCLFSSYYLYLHMPFIGHCYKQIWYFTPLFSSVVVSLGFGLVIRLFFWWRGDRPFYALLSSGFVWMLLSLCTLISIVSGLRDSFPFSSFSGSFLRLKGERKHREMDVRYADCTLPSWVMTGTQTTHRINVSRHRLESDHQGDVFVWSRHIQ